MTKKPTNCWIFFQIKANQRISGQWEQLWSKNVRKTGRVKKSLKVLNGCRWLCCPADIIDPWPNKVLAVPEFFSTTFCIFGEDSHLSGFVGKKKNFLFLRSHRSLQQSKKLFRTFSSGKWQMVKKMIKKKLTDIDKASRCALAELSRLVRKADFNNSWGKKWCQKLIWILTNLTRDMSRRGLYADCMICDQLTPDGDCSENNLKKI